MAGSMRKMAVYLGLVEDDSYVDEGYDDYDEPARESRREKRSTSGTVFSFSA